MQKISDLMKRQKEDSVSGVNNKVETRFVRPENNLRPKSTIPKFLKPVAVSPPPLSPILQTCLHKPIQAKLHRSSLHPSDIENNTDSDGTIQDQMISPQTEVRIKNMKGSGQPLSKAARNFFEPRFGMDLGQVRIHHDTSDANQTTENLAAKAFALGNDIVFGPDCYAENTHEGRWLMAHEIAHTVQQNGGPDAVQKNEEEQTESRYTYEYFGRQEIEGIRARAAARHFYASAYVATAQRLIQAYRQRLLAMQGRYERAYERYSTVIHLAREEARNQEEWIDICVGIGVGTLIGVAAMFIAPEAAAAITAAAVLKEGISEFLEEVTENLGTQGVEATGWTDVAGHDLQPDPDLSPVILEMEIWRTISRLYRDTLSLQEGMATDFMVNGAAEYAIGEIKAFVGGAEPDMSEDELWELIIHLFTIDRTLDPVLSDLESKMDTIRELETQELPVLEYSVDDIERDIWIMWIASLNMSESDILDLDAIENYLESKHIIGENSVLGIDFGWYTFEYEEIEAIRSASRMATDIRNRYDEISE